MNRPKGGGDKKVSSSRKTHGGQHDEDGNLPGESEEDHNQSREPDKDSEEIDEIPEQSIFKEVSEVRFPAEVGPLGN